MQFESSWKNKVAVVTGASSGIGRSIAVALSRLGVRLCIAGRNPVTLADTCEAVRGFSQADAFQVDLTVEDGLSPLFQHVEQHVGRLDFLVHSAGIARLGSMECSAVSQFDLQYVVNVRAPYLITRRLLPLLAASKGQIVFINSSVGTKAARSDVGQYAATKHALRAVADSLRAEVNARGVRVLTLYLGRTATPMQQRLYQESGVPYDPAILMQPDDVAAAVTCALLLPPTAEITEISMRPMQQSY